ncbi:IniB N-terminal domain-containing protein [Pseudarthrobacter sp. NS4]|uniref:IniB N-terminal domain-containing protein n=1 Tax=Pseudarthrobacter sp. NS4 TaxID=2973976 RepID=UPI0021632B99|nr:IniB N-terminal domain-containing protein [Pseudarthrobacter sp. NS4]
MTVAKDVVQFLMNLFADRQAAQDFLNDPEGVLEEHGLGEVSSADVDAAMPVVLDYAPVTINAARFDRDYSTGGGDSSNGHVGGAWSPFPGSGGHGHDDHGHAVQQLQHVVNNYSYPSTAYDPSTITDQSASQNIWADGDVEQWFDNYSVVASSDRAGASDSDMNMGNVWLEDAFGTDARINAGLNDLGDVNNWENSIVDSFTEDETTDASVNADLENAGHTTDEPQVAYNEDMVTDSQLEFTADDHPVIDDTDTGGDFEEEDHSVIDL